MNEVSDGRWDTRERVTLFVGQIRSLRLSPPPIRDLVHLRRAFDALYLFHRCYEPTEDHAAFRSRLAACVAMVVGFGKEDAACRSLEAADPFDVYQMLAQASDTELQHRVESLVSAPDRPTQVKDGAST